MQSTLVVSHIRCTQAGACTCRRLYSCGAMLAFECMAIADVSSSNIRTVAQAADVAAGQNMH
jgi:hypothetical protein